MKALTRTGWRSCCLRPESNHLFKLRRTFSNNGVKWSKGVKSAATEVEGSTSLHVLTDDQKHQASTVIVLFKFPKNPITTLWGMECGVHECFFGTEIMSWILVETIRWQEQKLLQDQAYKTWDEVEDCMDASHFLWFNRTNDVLKSSSILINTCLKLTRALLTHELK